MLEMVVELVLIVVGTGCATLAIYRDATKPDGDGIEWNTQGYLK